MKRFKSVDEFIETSPEHYRAALILLREILNGSGLEESVKWGMPVYTLNNKNVVGIGYFQSYFGLWFFQGIFLPDNSKVLINAQEGKTQAMRQWRFESIDQINVDLVKVYIQDAIQNQKDGKEFKPTKKPLIIPDTLKEVLNSMDGLGTAFENLSLTMKREYAEYIDSAKRENTQKKRLEKIIPMILKGKGLNDRYR